MALDFGQTQRAARHIPGPVDPALAADEASTDRWANFIRSHRAGAENGPPPYLIFWGFPSAFSI